MKLQNPLIVTLDTPAEKTHYPRSGVGSTQEQANPRGASGAGDGEGVELVSDGSASEATGVVHSIVTAVRGVQSANGQTAGQAVRQVGRQVDRGIDESAESLDSAVVADYTISVGALSAPETGVLEGLYGVTANPGRLTLHKAGMPGALQVRSFIKPASDHLKTHLILSRRIRL